MKNKFKILALPLVLIIAFILRIKDYTKIALWHDEAFSSLLTQMPFSEMMARIALDVHPPFYYWLLRFWTDLFGHNLSALRGFSVLFGVLTVWALYLLVKKISGQKSLAIAAALILAVNPFHVQYSLEARMYTLGTFLIVISSFVLLKALENNKWKWWLSLSVLTAMTALTHYYLLFSVLAQGIFAVIWWWKKYQPKFSKVNLRWLWSYLISLLLYVFWLPTFFKHLTQVQENYWIPAMDLWSLPSTIWKIMLGGFQGAEESILIVSLITALILLGIYIAKYKNLKAWHLIFMSLIPFLAAIIFSFKTAIFLDRYFIFAAVFLIAIIAMAILSFSKKIGWIIIGFWAIASLFSYQIAWQNLNVSEKPGMTAASDHILEKRINDCPDNNAEIIVSSTFIYFSYQHYHNLNQLELKEMNLRCPVYLPKPMLYLQGINDVSELPHFSGTALLENKDIINNLNNINTKTIYLLWTTGFGGNKSEVPSNWQEISEQKFPDVFPHRGDIFVTQYKISN